MNTTLTPATSLITHIDGKEAPAAGRWAVVPGHTWTILSTRPGPLAAKASASGPAVSGTVDIDFDPHRCRMNLTVDTRRLTSDHPALARALANQSLQIDAVRTGRFGTGGWDVAGAVANGDEAVDFEAWIDYRGVYRRGRDLAYAWLTMNVTVPAAALGMFDTPLGRRRQLSMNIDILATANESTTPIAA